MTSTNAQPRCYPRGSEWRKWDLHLHPPGTKLSDGYTGSAALDRFCEILESSDVDVFGITDYFSADGFFSTVARFRKLYPSSHKVLFPNIELRLSETVNGSNQLVDLHLIFRPDVTRTIIDRFLRELKTEITDSNGVSFSCSDIATTTHFEQATVTRANVERAIEQAFGKSAARSDHLIIIVPSNNNGIRAGGGEQRKRNLADQIDKLSDAIYGNSGNTDYFLRTDRYEDSAQKSKPKPVFSCSDAHSFDQLTNWLGKSIDGAEARKEVTWIKADPTFEGLQQTLYEPSNRVSIQTAKPEVKEPYKVISAVHFTGPDFPETIILNHGLVSIIGSRSSGKSSLLAYIAHSVDPIYTVTQQVATRMIDEAKAGPAAGKTWANVSHIKCTVEWADPNVSRGKIIYIPQNSLFAVSERPEEITAKIEPVLFRMDSSLQTAYLRMHSDIELSRAKISDAVTQWFRIDDRIKALQIELRDLGDPNAIGSTRDMLAVQITELRASAKLSKDDVVGYQRVIEQLGASTSRRETIAQESAAIAPYLTHSDGERETAGVSVSVTIAPSASTFPVGLEAELTSIVTQAMASLNGTVSSAVIAYQLSLDTESAHLLSAEDRLKADNAELIERNQANAELEELIRRHNKQDELLKTIASRQEKLEELAVSQEGQAETIRAEIGILTDHVQSFTKHFNTRVRALENMLFGVEHQINEETIQALSASFNRQENTDYVDRSSELVRIGNIIADPDKFLRSLRDGRQKLRRGTEPVNLAVQALSIAPEVRFIATLEGDRIGGFKRSSMTPGKQSLFALSLILNESAEGWPLLIDQPEDDLDSRSIFDTIVPYLLARKRDRQILMVSRDANLVVGADSDQLIVANRHGDDRKNRDGRTFEYLTGSLEYSLPETKADHVLEKCGIREHACEILDGGVEAFQKRRDKYNI